MPSEPINDGTPQMETPTVPCNAELVAKIRKAIPYVMQAIDRAKLDHPEAKIKLMIAAENPDKSGNIVCRMDSAEFLTDVAELVGYVTASTGEKARFLLGRLGLGKAEV